MTLRELLIRSHDLPQKESFNFRVEQIGPFLGGAGVLLSREEREVRFLTRLVFGVNVFWDTLGHLCFNKGLPGRLYEGKVFVRMEDPDEEIVPNEKNAFLLTENIANELQVIDLRIEGLTRTRVFNGREVVWEKNISWENAYWKN